MGAFRAEFSLEDILKITMTQPSQADAAPNALRQDQTGQQIRKREKKSKRPARKAYSPAEDAILADHYSRSGAQACADRLPGRNANSIKQRAAVLGLKPPPHDRHQGLKHTLCAEQRTQALAMHDAGTAFAAIGRHFGVCEATATNAVHYALCLRNGDTPAKRDSTGSIIARDIARLRAMLREGHKGCDIARKLGISANSVSYHRRQYQRELQECGESMSLPPPGNGCAYSGRKIDAQSRQAVINLLMSGMGSCLVSRETGVSKTQIGRIRKSLIAWLAANGQCLPGCTPDGRRNVIIKSARFITFAQRIHLQQLLLDRIPVRRAAQMVGIGASSAYRLRDEFRTELGRQGGSLPSPKLPGRGSRDAIHKARWLSTQAVYEFRRKLDNTDFETAKAEILAETIQSEKREQPTACPQDFTRKRALSFAEQLERVANGARLITVQPLRRADADMTYGGVASYGE